MSEAPGYPAAKHEFLLRRLHSLAGLVPVGAFLVFHLGANAGITLDSSGDFYQRQVNLIHSLGPMLIPVEFLFIFLPLGFHAALGVKMWLQEAPNTKHYQYWGNVRYRLQRITGVVALVFILAHLWQMHWLAGRLPGGGMFDHEHAAGTTAWILQNHAVWAGPLYLLGILASTFHLANGVWTSLITWGITIGPNAQRKAGYVCAVIGVALALAGTGSLWGFMRFEKPMEPKKVREHGEARAETRGHGEGVWQHETAGNWA